MYKPTARISPLSETQIAADGYPGSDLTSVLCPLISRFVLSIWTQTVVRKEEPGKWGERGKKVAGGREGIGVKLIASWVIP